MKSRQSALLANGRKLIGIPLGLYHADLQVLPLRDNVVLVNSFEQTREFLQQNGTQVTRDLTAMDGAEGNARYGELCNAARDLEHRLETRVVDVICRKLKRAGLTPVKCCGSLMHGINKEGHPIDALTLFINAVPVKKGEEHHLITLKSTHMQTHADYFSALCRDFGVQVHFVGTSTMTPEKWLAGWMGGVRCMTHFGLFQLLNRNHVPDTDKLAD